MFFIKSRKQLRLRKQRNLLTATICLILSGIVVGQNWTLEYTFLQSNSSKTKTFQLWLPEGSVSIRGLVMTNSVSNDKEFATSAVIRNAAASKDLGVLRIIGAHYSTFGAESQGQGPEKISDRLGEGYATLAEEFLGILGKLADETGHPELRHVPFLTFGHSTSGIFARNIAWWKPERCFGVIIYKSGKYTKPQWARPDATLKDIPLMMFPGEFEQGAPGHHGCVYTFGTESMEVQWWANRDSVVKFNTMGYCGMVTAQPLDPSLGIDTCFTTTTRWSGCGTNHPACNMHTQWVGSEYRGEQALNLLAQFITKAADMRLPQEPPLTKPRPLKSIDKTEGVFVTTTELRHKIIEADLSSAPKMIYHYEEFPGDPDTVFWFFDHEFALDWMYYMNDAGAYTGSNKGYIPMVSEPVISVVQNRVSITSPTNNAVIYYATDGDPARDRDGIPYSGPFTLAEDESVRAIAFKRDDTYDFDWRPSKVVSWPQNSTSVAGAGKAPLSAGMQRVQWRLSYNLDSERMRPVTQLPLACSCKEAPA